MIVQYQDKIPVINDGVFIEKSAQVIGDVTLEENVGIWFNAVVRGDINYIKIGRGTNIQDNCVLHVGHGEKYALVIGEKVTVGHSAILHACVVQDLCLIGMGATILDGVVIGTGSIIAAGSVLTPNQTIPPRSLVAGIPGKIKRQVTEEEIEQIKESAQHYIILKEKYRK